MARRKLVLIGAGSTVFTQRLVADIILAGEEDQGPLVRQQALAAPNRQEAA